MPTITVQHIHATIKDGNAIFIDVRSAEEFAKGHAKGFINIPLDEIAQDISRVPKADTIYFICHSGGRSLLATKLAISHGLNAGNIEDGFSAWQKAGFPVE